MDELDHEVDGHEESYEERNDETAGGVDEKTDSPVDDGLLSTESAREFRKRWSAIQAGFVDQPRRSVEAADRMVTEVIDEVTRSFKQQRSGLENQWVGDGVSTEELRLALRRYRTFLERLVS